jgi:hypothetical protein
MAALCLGRVEVALPAGRHQSPATLAARQPAGRFPLREHAAALEANDPVTVGVSQAAPSREGRVGP